VSADIELVIPISTLMATRTYDAILRTSRFRESEPDLAVIGSEVTSGWRQYVVAEACGFNLDVASLDRMLAADALPVLRGWLSRYQTAQIYPVRVWAPDGPLDRASAHHTDFVEYMTRLIEACAANPDATLRYS
jgi:hypothetical protein